MILTARGTLRGALAMLAATGSLLSSGCDACRSSDLFYRVGLELEGGLTDAPWGGRFDPAPFSVTAIVASMYPGFEPVDEVVELYAGGVRLSPPRFTRLNVHRTGDCPHDELHYDLTGLAPGEYLVVHRRRTAPADYTAGFQESDWTVFEGEQAAVLTLVLGPP